MNNSGAIQRSDSEQTKKRDSITSQKLVKETNPQKYTFSFSPAKVLDGETTIFRFTTILLLVLFTILVPLAWILDEVKVINFFPQDDIKWGIWYIYVIIVNTVLIIVLGKYIISSSAYVFQNSFAKRAYFSNFNKQFGEEFKSTVQKMSLVINDMMINSDNQTSRDTRNIVVMSGRETNSGTLDDQRDQGFHPMEPGDIYYRIAQNLELIQLYTNTSEQEIQEAKDNKKKSSSILIRFTQILVQLRQVLDQIEVKSNFNHPWFPKTSTDKITFWQYFNKFNLEADKKEQGADIKRFFKRYISPSIPKTAENKKLIGQLNDLTTQLVNVILQSSTSNKCTICCLKRDNLLFGRFVQARLILQKQFQGRQYFVKGPDNNKIDCMFFPCMINEKVVLKEERNSVFSNQTKSQIEPPRMSTFKSDKPLYIEKPTIIMCQPNAMFYQQMVIGPNAYWLNFFLKREINVICWNYRGYGESEISLFHNVSPSSVKSDAEFVLSDSVRQLQLTGKIGIYGRSIGGIAACHLANKYADLVQVLVIDRSLNELKSVIESKFRGRNTTIQMVSAFYHGWECKNAQNYASNDVQKNQVYKIVTCDRDDTIVDMFSSTVAGVAEECSKYKYEKESFHWMRFQQSLVALTHFENKFQQEWHTEDPDESEYEIDSFVKSHHIEDTVTKVEAKLAADQTYMPNHIKFEEILEYPTVDFLDADPNKFPAMPDTIQNLLHGLIFLLLEFEAGPAFNLGDCIGMRRSPLFKEFLIFLKVIEVYGCGYQDDVNYRKYNIRNVETHKESMIKQINSLLRVYDQLIYSINLESQYGNLDVQFLKKLTHVLEFQRAFFVKMVDIQNNLKKEELDNDFKPTREGHLVNLACGHGGQPSRIEEKRVSRLIRKSGFIPMLDQIQEEKIKSRNSKPLKPRPLKQIESTFEDQQKSSGPRLPSQRLTNQPPPKPINPLYNIPEVPLEDEDLQTQQIRPSESKQPLSPSSQKQEPATESSKKSDDNNIIEIGYEESNFYTANNNQNNQSPVKIQSQESNTYSNGLQVSQDYTVTETEQTLNDNQTQLNTKDDEGGNANNQLIEPIQSLTDSLKSNKKIDSIPIEDNFVPPVIVQEVPQKVISGGITYSFEKEDSDSEDDIYPGNQAGPTDFSDDEEEEDPKTTHTNDDLLNTHIMTNSLPNYVFADTVVLGRQSEMKQPNMSITPASALKGHFDLRQSFHKQGTKKSFRQKRDDPYAMGSRQAGLSLGLKGRMNSFKRSTQDADDNSMNIYKNAQYNRATVEHGFNGWKGDAQTMPLLLDDEQSGIQDDSMDQKKISQTEYSIGLI